MFVTTDGAAARQRDRAAPAQQRPLHDRRVRDLAVRAAGARARRPAARRRAAARAGGDGEPAGRHLVRRRGARRRASPTGRDVLRHPRREAPPLRQGGAAARAQDGARDVPRRDARRRARDGARDQARPRRFRAPTSCDRRSRFPGERRPREARGTGPLAGLRVLDLTRLLPGPVCTLYLADLGADVVKIEDTGAGDYARNLGNRAGTVSGLLPRGQPQQAQRRRSISRTRGDATAFLALARRADVIVESFRPGVVAALGVDYEAVAALNPRIVYASISGYGQNGPRAHARRATTSTTSATPACSTRPARATSRRRFATCRSPTCWAAPATAAIALLAALVGAQRTGRGRYVDVAMADASLAHNIVRAARARAMGTTCAARRRSPDRRRPVLRRLPDAATGAGSRSARSRTKFWQRAVRGDRRGPISSPGQFAPGDEGARVRAASSSAIFAGATLAEWTSTLAAVDCCVTPVATLDEALERSRSSRRAKWCARAATARVEYAPPWKLSGHEFTVARRSASAWASTAREILREARLRRAAIDRRARSQRACVRTS